MESVARIHASGAGVPETSYYGALEQLFDRVGASLTPAITAVINLRDQGAGIPDGGLFAANQLARADGPRVAFDRQLPTHGAVEAKPANAQLNEVANSSQVARYLQRYGKVLVTNFREFQLVTVDADGSAALGERFSLADEERTFWVRVSAPDQLDMAS